MFVKIVLVILLVSFALSIWSLKNESTKKETAEVKNKLKKGRVIFQSSDSTSSE